MSRTTNIEQELVNSFIDKIKACAKADNKQCSFTQLETGATAIGVPDLLMFYDNSLYWIEAKRFRCPPKTRNTNKYRGELVFRPGQLRFLQKLYQAKEKVFILALTEWMDAVIIPIYKVPKDAGAVLKFEEDGADFPNIYDYMKEIIL